MKDYLLCESSEEDIIYYDALNKTIETVDKSKPDQNKGDKDLSHSKNHCKHCGLNSNKNPKEENDNIKYENVDMNTDNIINEINIQIDGIIFLSIIRNKHQLNFH